MQSREFERVDELVAHVAEALTSRVIHFTPDDAASRRFARLSRCLSAGTDDGIWVTVSTSRFEDRDDTVVYIFDNAKGRFRGMVYPEGDRLNCDVVISGRSSSPLTYEADETHVFQALVDAAAENPHGFEFDCGLEKELVREPLRAPAF
jgi:hypothetical protein